MAINRQFVKKAVVRMHEQGTTPGRISQLSGVPVTTVRRWIVESDSAYHEANLEKARAQKERKQHDMRAVLALAKKGVAPAKIAEELEMNWRRVHRLLTEHRRNCQGEGEWQSFGDCLRAKIAADRRDGLPMRRIAKRVGRALGTVHYHLVKLGLDGHLDSAKPRAGKAEVGNAGDVAPRKTGLPAEAETNTLLTHVAEYTSGRMKPVYPCPDDRCDLLLVIGNYTLIIQVRTGRRRGKSLSASITRSKGRPYRPDSCDLLFAYDERTRELYCRLGADVWQRRASIAFRPEDAVSHEDPQRLVALIEEALAIKRRRLREEEEEHPEETPDLRYPAAGTAVGRWWDPTLRRA